MGTIKWKNEGENALSEAEIRAESAATEERERTDAEEAFYSADPSILCEDLEKREQNVKYFKRNDGTAKSVISTVALHYFDEEKGRLETIDGTLTEKDGRFVTRKGGCRAELAKDLSEGRTLRFGRENVNLEWKYLPKASRAATRAAVFGAESVSARFNAASEAKFEEADENTDLEYQFFGDNVKENIIVKSRAEEYAYAFELNTNGLELKLSEDNASIELYSSGTNASGEREEKIEFTIPSPFMYDRKGERSDDVYYEIEQKPEGSYIFRVIASAEWINAEEREFPVTIDPQIVTNKSDIYSYQNQYRYLSSGSYGSSGPWNGVSLGYIAVRRNSSQEFRTLLTIKKSNMNLAEHKISKATLQLRSNSSGVPGWITVNNKNYYCGLSQLLEVDITDTFRNAAGDFTVTITPYTTVDLSFPTVSANGFFLEVEYLTNEKTRLTKKRFPLGGIASGDLNLSTGELVTSFSDVPGENTLLGDGIFHVYKKSANDFGAGKNFRLNLHEELKKNSEYVLDTNYIYTDAFGEKHGFKDTYYYLNSSNSRVDISEANKKDITAELDGRLTYNNREVFKDQRTSSGWKAITQLDKAFKNADLVEQRQDEVKQLEEQVESYRNTLKDIVCVNKSGGIIVYRLKDYFSNNELAKSNFDTFVGYVSSSRLVLSESEALSYRAMKLQYEAMQNQELSIAHQRDSLDLQETGMSLQIGSINNTLNEDEQLSPNVRQNYQATRDNLNAQSINLRGQRNLIEDNIQPNNTSQKNNLSDQIVALENKRAYYIDQVKKIYKEFAIKTSELKQLKNQLPINYLTDGKIVKGFNEAGQLVAIYDNYKNSIVIEYNAKNRIAKVYENETKVNVFEYNYNGLLSSITDTRGRKTNYTYDLEGKLTKVDFADGYTLNLVYDELKNIVTVSDSNQLKTDVTYGKTTIELKEYSKVSTIPYTQALADNFPVLSDTLVPFNLDETVVDDKRGTKEYYVFGANGNLTQYLLEEQNKVTKAERYTFTPYLTDRVEYARKDTLNVSPKTSFAFVAEDTETTELNQFNNPKKTSTNARKIDLNSTQSTVTEYFYNNDRKCKRAETTVTTTTPAGITNRKSVTKYLYNANGDVVRTENYIAGEEETSGVTIEEVIFDEQGNPVKSFRYNSLDSSSKFYSENEYSENGQVCASLDETGENRTKIRYVEGTTAVAAETAPNGSTFAYGRDLTDAVTSISQSTAEGEENATETRYTCGLPTKLKSGNKFVDYTYDAKRRLTKVGLNGNAEYLTYAYEEDVTEDGILSDKTVVTNAKDETFTSFTDKRGNVRKILYGSAPQVTSTYDAKNRLTQTIDAESGTTTYEYDGLDRPTAVNCGGIAAETFTYDDWGKLATRNLSNGVSHAYAYSYRDDAAHTLSEIGIKGLAIRPKQDVNGRVSEKTISDTTGVLTGEYYYYAKYGDHATNRISTIRYGNRKGGKYVIGDGIKYEYDRMGNISKVYENGAMLASYTYDGVNRLIREDNKRLNKTSLFTYDNNGNILTKRESAYTVKSMEEIENATELRYRYDAASDRLMSVGEESFEYDAIGNPEQYKGIAVTWTKGRQMTGYGEMTFSYDGRGMRRSKRKGNGTAIEYTYDSEGRLIKESNGLEYIYDESGTAGVIHNGTPYLYRKNAQGDIIGLIDNTGRVVVNYVYDGWGNHRIYGAEGEEITDAAHIGSLNPIRYRGYYYDTETKLYFLKTRYYDPELCRFVTIDDTAYLDPNAINGLNLYAYCLNNPVMFIDPNGNAWWEFWKWDWGKIFTGIGMVITAVAAVALSVVTFGAGTPLAVGIIAGITLAGGVLTGINGIATIGEGISGGYNFVRDGLFNEVLGLSDRAYNIYAGVAEGVAIVGSMILGVYQTTGRAQAARIGRNFLGKGYSKQGPGRWVSEDGFRQLRLDNHRPFGKHFNLETWKYPIGAGSRNKLIENIHRLFKWFKTWVG